MSVPPIPQQEIAKLVLGYLAKEQLWTAYDEFLQSSPYLDALENEYERIFMASLQQILSDYRTVSILVEKCQPLLLRRRLMQFTNLTDTVTYLINNIDQQKIVKPCKVRTSYPSRECQQCKSINCLCKSNELSMHISNLSNSQNMVETTTFADLPGNHSTSIKKKCIKTIPRHATELTFDHFTNDDSGHVLGLQSDDKDPNYDGLLCQENNSSERSMKSTELGMTNSNLKYDSLNAVPQDQDATDGYQMKIVPDWNENNTVYKSQNDNIITTPRSTLPNRNRRSSLITTVASSENKPKTNVNSVQILSNIVVDQDMALKKCDGKNPPSVLNNKGTVQSMAVNGNLAYKSDGCGMFPKVDIMTMPTILVVPGSGTSQIPLQSESQKILYTNALSESFGPLTIDISSEDSAPISTAVTDKNDLVSILEKNATVPKDNVVSILGKNSTPQFLPPTRKSSSTPRRSSHIRVLDFTTPRRILSETKENVTSRIESIEVIVSKSPERKEKESIVNTNKEDNSTKENVSGPKTKKKNWDDDLRALILNSQNESSKQPKVSTKSSKKKSTEKEPKADKSKTKKSDSKLTKDHTKSSRKKKHKETKNKEKTTVNAERKIDYVPQSTVKPNIKVVSDWVSPPKEGTKAPPVTNDLENDTPEMDRISLQNAIGAKLNISDLLETPFKQALYDIQMDTPRFLQPDIPCEPVSDIKITDIPTPRFFNPGLNQATPNSYSSRPTDYSSGGSYYKPDEQDYVLPEFENKPSCSKNGVRSSKESNNASKEKSSGEKPSRPVRQCTKNVSYCKTKTKPEKQGNSSSESSADESMDFNVSDNSKSDNNSSITNKIKTKPKSERKSTNMKKTPLSLKKSPKKFMKIKPRQTPSLARSKARQVPTKRASLKLSPKHKNVNKDKTSPGNLLAAPAKSRRKSSTPRKVHTVDSSKNSSLDNNKDKEMPKLTVSCVPDSDSDIPLRWSEDGSTDKAVKFTLSTSLNESDDIGKIKEFIETAADDSVVKSSIKIPEDNGSLHIDLIKRGFDIETAKSIERDLLDPGSGTREHASKTSKTIQIDTTESHLIDTNISESDNNKTETDSKLQTTEDQNDDSEEEIDLSIHDCNEETENFTSVVYDESASNENMQVVNLKETYSMEVCLDDDVIRLRATNFATIFEFTSQETNSNDSIAETEAAVRSLRNIFTPSKDAKSQCLEIFDSTLTSLDTPLKSPKKSQATVTEMVCEAISKEKGKKRKRGTSGGCEEEADTKKKRGTCYIANIKDMDIESVLSKLHGP